MLGQRIFKKEKKKVNAVRAGWFFFFWIATFAAHIKNGESEWKINFAIFLKKDVFIYILQKKANIDI